MKFGTEPAKEAAFGILKNKHLRGPRTDFDGSDGLNRAVILPLLEKAGRPEGYQVYLELLDVKGLGFGNASYGTPVAKLAVNEILRSFGKNNAELKRIRGLKEFEEQRLAVRRWVEAKIKGSKYP